MSAPNPPQSASDRNLLFGVLALQLDFVSRDALVGAMHAWVLDKHKPLGMILQEQGQLPAEHRELLEALVAAHLKQHGNDPEQSLRSLSSLGPVRQELSRIADADVQGSLVKAAAHPRTQDPEATQDLGASPQPAGGRFRILRPHARGGLGEVFVARDTELGREVALKQIQDRHADDPASRARFLLEAEVTGGLEHPGVVPVYGLGSYADGRPFYAMRFIKGDSLKEAVERFHRAEGPARDPGERALEFRRLLGRFVDVCNAIEYAHSRGVLHRDLKPGNVMLGKYGETLVVDWGLAKPLHRSFPAEATGDGTLRPPSGSGSGVTQAGSAVGTPAYMSPEQAAGRLEELGPASDVYSLGATLYHLLSGRPPFTGDDVAAVIQAVGRGDFPRLRDISPGVPAALEAVCHKAMALQPADRYVSASALAEDVEHWLADEPVAAYPEPWPARARRWAARHRTAVATSAAALVVLAGCLSVATALLTAANERERYARRAEEQARADAERQAEAATLERRRADGNARTAARQRDEARRNLYAADMALAQRAWEEARVDQMLAYLEEARPRAGEPDLRSFEWYYLKRLSHQELLTLKGHPQPVTSVAFSPDGKRLATASGDKSARVWNAGSGRELLALRGHSGRVNGVAFSPDGKRLATASEDGTARVWDTGSGRELLVLKGHTWRVNSVAFSPDGQRLATASEDQTARVWDAASGRELLALKGHAKAVTSVSFSPDGKRLATASRDGTARVWDAGSGQELLALKNFDQWFTSVAFSPDGQRLATASGEAARVWDAGSGREPLALRGHTGIVFSVAFSPDSQRLATASSDRTARLWDVGSGRELLALKGHATGTVSVAFSPDGQRLATVSRDKTVRVWDAGSGRKLLALKGHTGEVAGVAFSPDGKRLATASYDRTARVWDAGSGRELLVLKGHTWPVNGVAFSPDGTRLATASWDKTARMWDAANGRELLTLQGHTEPVLGAAFSPDGNRLATASADKTARVWDTDTGRELLTLKGHTGEVAGVAFSPDGKRLATASYDRTARLWDAGSGRELLALRGHSGRVAGVAFSPDGKRLATASGDNTAWVWETIPPTPEVVMRRAAVRLVCELFDELLLRQLVLARLDSIPCDKRTRDAAKEIAMAWPEDAGLFHHRSWSVVKQPGHSPEEYVKAVRLAEAAYELKPDNGYLLNTLGVAQYRVAEYYQALELLTRLELRNAAKPSGAQPANVAFVAMTLSRLGRKDEARQRLNVVRQLLKQPTWAKDADAAAFRREAEALIEPAK